jgi:hypothetical protein
MCRHSTFNSILNFRKCSGQRSDHIGAFFECSAHVPGARQRKRPAQRAVLPLAPCRAGIRLKQVSAPHIRNEKRQIADRHEHDGHEHQFGKVIRPRREITEQRQVIGLRSQESVIRSQDRISGSGDGAIKQSPPDHARERHRNGAHLHAQRQIEHRCNDPAVIDEKQRELGIGKIIDAVRCEKRLQRAAQTPEIGDLETLLRGPYECYERGDGRPVAKIERNFIADIEPALEVEKQRSS